MRRLARRSTTVAISVVSLVACTSPPPTPPAPPGSTSATVSATLPSATPSVPKTSYPKFPTNSVFHADVRRARLAKNSPAMIANLRKQIRNHYGGIAGLNIDAYSASLAVASRRTEKVNLRLENCQDKSAMETRGLFGPAGVFTGVPMPRDAVPAPGSDGHLAVWAPHEDRLWEFWRARRRPDGNWQACWGGRIDGVSRARGQFPPPYGVSASGLATAGYMITLEEGRAGQIDHAMGLVLVSPKAGWSYPANRGDGTSRDPNAIPEGTRLRLDPAVDLNSLRLPSFAAAIARAAQRYGFIVIDRGGAVTVMAEGGAQERRRTGVDPWPSILGSTPAHAQLVDFPWGNMQVIEHDWGKPGR